MERNNSNTIPPLLPTTRHRTFDPIVWGPGGGFRASLAGRRAALASMCSVQSIQDGVHFTCQLPTSSCRRTRTCALSRPALPLGPSITMRGTASAPPRCRSGPPFQLPHLWVGRLPVCLAEHHEGRVRRLRLVLATKSHLLTCGACYTTARIQAEGVVLVAPGDINHSQVRSRTERRKTAVSKHCIDTQHPQSIGECTVPRTRATRRASQAS